MEVAAEAAGDCSSPERRRGRRGPVRALRPHASAAAPHEPRGGRCGPFVSPHTSLAEVVVALREAPAETAVAVGTASTGVGQNSKFRSTRVEI